jgi:dihydroorotate dehydrogenase (fumarate)
MMVDLSTTYMGLELKHPVVPSASPLSRDLATIKAMEDAGAAAIVMHSIFEEQIELEQEALHHFLEQGTELFSEALTYFPPMPEYKVGPDEYLDHIRQAKDAVDIPIIGSLNGISLGGWVDYARQIEQAGADGVELNVYFVAANPRAEAAEVENLYLDILAAVKENVRIPVALKLSPFFSSMSNVARRVDGAGADALVLFNRFYQPDIDLENLEVERSLVLSTSDEMRLPLRWIAILYGRVKASLALTSGIHTPQDVLKAVMAGSDVANVCSVLLKHGLGKIGELVGGVMLWMEEHEYESIRQMKGSLSQQAIAEPAAFERANYIRILQRYQY